MLEESEGSYIGLDVGGTFLKAARVSGAGEIEARLHEPIVRAPFPALLAQLRNAVQALDPTERPAAAVGVGLPGIVETDSGRVRNAPALPVLNGVDVASELTRLTGKPAFLANDANAAALAELWRGAGRGAASLLLVTIGTGIGGGLVLDGRIWAGRSGYAGEIGHIQVEEGGVACACGSRGCLETVAGAAGFRREVERRLATKASALTGTALDQQTIMTAAQQGDAVAEAVVDRAAWALGIGIAAVLDLLNLERVVLAGGVAAAGAYLLDRVVAQVQRRTFAAVFADCTFDLSRLGGDAGSIGAARVAMFGSR